MRAAPLPSSERALPGFLPRFTCTGRTKTQDRALTRLNRHAIDAAEAVVLTNGLPDFGPPRTADNRAGQFPPLPGRREWRHVMPSRRAPCPSPSRRPLVSDRSPARPARPPARRGAAPCPRSRGSPPRPRRPSARCRRRPAARRCRSPRALSSTLMLSALSPASRPRTPIRAHVDRRCRRHRSLGDGDDPDPVRPRQRGEHAAFLDAEDRTVS